MSEEKILLEAEEIDRALRRMANEILEKNKGAEKLYIVGLPNGGAVPSQIMHNYLQQFADKSDIPYALLDTTPYRDDSHVSVAPLKEENIVKNVHDTNVVIFDDVLYTGRTVRAAMNALVDYGRPSLIQLAVLVDRGHREFPIRPDYVGKNIPTSKSEEVKLITTDSNIEKVVLYKK